jgi:hypothetical protein
VKRPSPRGGSRRDVSGSRPPAAPGAAAPHARQRTEAAFQPISRAWLTVVACVAAAIVALTVTAPLQDKDVWQHLAVGRAMWTLHGVPHTDLWTWPGYGTPYLLPSWLFRALLWPFWAAGGLVGLYAWRWLTTLAAFAILWRTARRAGATGAAPILMLVWCALFYRQRSQLRPDTLVAVLLAAQMWVLEARRNGARVHPAWLVAIGWAWVNAHISYPLFFVIGIAYLADATWRARRTTGAAYEHPRGLALALLAALAAGMLNPFGFAALAQPFDYVLHGSHEPIYRNIIELRPLLWSWNVRNGLIAFLVVLTLLAARRARRDGPDLAQWLLLPALAYQMVTSQRFIGYFAIVAAPFAARDLAAALRGVRWPAFVAAPAVRAALVAGLCVVGAIPELTRPDWPLQLGLDPVAYPVYACDWIAKHEVRGRAFNAYSQGGYLLWRFWPQRDRLPFMDIHQTGTRRDRDLYTYAWADSSAWRELDAERRFDWALVPRKQGTAQRLLEYLDADPDWAMVFADDAAALYLRRDGAMADTASRAAFRWVPGGSERISRMARAVELDLDARDAARAELARMIADSRSCGQAHSQLANLEGLDGHWDAAIEQLELARAIDPSLPRLAEREQMARDRRAGDMGRAP